LILRRCADLLLVSDVKSRGIGACLSRQVLLLFAASFGSVHDIMQRRLKHTTDYRYFVINWRITLPSAAMQNYLSYSCGKNAFHLHLHFNYGFGS